MITSDKSFDFLVFIGRFQPYHLGHESVVASGLTRAKKLIIMIGSAHRPRCTRNPWTFHEREKMIRSTLSESENERVIITPIMDATYNDDMWTCTVQKSVDGLVTAHHSEPHRLPKVGLIGYAKDNSSYYLKLFPQWDSVDVASKKILNATDVRNIIFHADQGLWEDKKLSLKSLVRDSGNEMVSEVIYNILRDFIRSEDFVHLRNEYSFVEKYKESWSKAPYKPTFVTVDAVVVQSGHVLLVERGASPGKGQWALPGGFINHDEKIKDACIRELKEETRIKVPVPVLEGHIVDNLVFDDPHRSARGRTITHAYLIQLNPDTELPKVRGSDDAKKAFWMPLAKLKPELMYEDHYFIIQRLVGQLN